MIVRVAVGEREAYALQEGCRSRLSNAESRNTSAKSDNGALVSEPSKEQSSRPKDRRGDTGLGALTTFFQASHNPHQQANLSGTHLRCRVPIGWVCLPVEVKSLFVAILQEPGETVSSTGQHLA